MSSQVQLDMGKGRARVACMRCARILVLIACVGCQDAAHPLDPRAPGPLAHVVAEAWANDEALAQVESVIALVRTLCDASELNRGQCTALLATLEAAYRSVLAGNTQAATGQLGAFINQVVAFGRSDALPPDAVQSLVNEAGKAIGLLDG